MKVKTVSTVGLRGCIGIFNVIFYRYAEDWWKANRFHNQHE